MRRSRPPHGDDLRFVPDDVDEMHRHQSGAPAAFAVRADSTEVMRVAQADANDAGALDALDCDVGCFATDHLAKAEPTVDEHDGARVAHDRGVRTGVEVTRAQVVHVRRDHADAVRVVSLQIRFDEMRGDFARDVVRCTGVREDVGDEVTQSGGLHQHVVLRG